MREAGPNPEKIDSYLLTTVSEHPKVDWSNLFSQWAITARGQMGSPRTKVLHSLSKNWKVYTASLSAGKLGTFPKGMESIKSVKFHYE